MHPSTIIIAMHWFSITIHPSPVILAGVSSIGLFFWVYFTFSFVYYLIGSP